jgi:hypothetical protein
MGYSFSGRHRTTDDESIFYTECMYAYEPVFKQCFGKEISKFSGRVTIQKIKEFEIGLEKFKSNKNNLNSLIEEFPQNLSNITHDKLCEDLSELLRLMKNKKVCYLHIG